MSLNFIYLSIVCLIVIAGCVNSAQALSYRAAVVEYSPEGNPWNEEPLDVIRRNLDNYVGYVKEASQLGADLVVFPEYGITTLRMATDRIRARPLLQQLPALNSSASEEICRGTETAGNESLSFSVLSCAARESSIYLVANLGEIVPCVENEITTDGPCPQDGAFQYNTDVVFDRRGQLIAKYRKSHLFLEPQFQTPEVPDHVTFTTDFGVTFGVFTCFDIVFFEPALPLYLESGIRDFVFPTAWVDELPFLTAVQMQNSWSRSLGVNLIASGYHYPPGGQLGSGIFDPSGALNYTFDPESGSRLLLAEVNTVTSEMANEIPVGSLFPADELPRWKRNAKVPHAMLYEDLSNYSSTVIHLSNGNHASTLELCHQDIICCSLNYTTTVNSPAIYRLLAYSGERSLGGGLYHVNIQLCGIVACTSMDLSSCTKDIVEGANFQQLDISGNFSTGFVFPTYLDTDLQLFPNSDIAFAKSEDNHVTLTARNELPSLLSAGLYARLYQQDSDQRL